NLTRSSLSWRWVPRYPRCAGVSAGIQTIYTAMAAGAHDISEGRFQKRLHLLMDRSTRTSILELQTLHMSDSGTFFCASPSQDAPRISVTVTPGNSIAGGPGARTPGFSPWLGGGGLRILMVGAIAWGGLGAVGYTHWRTRAQPASRYLPLSRKRPLQGSPAAPAPCGATPAPPPLPNSALLPTPCSPQPSTPCGAPPALLHGAMGQR
uniref:G6b-B extracellular V-set Ig-like domain-containing protein n=1 Tax=Chelonoidis abingdonii TaxID=106734 RepID=A0A8C0G7B9_CHEAB